MYQHRHKTISKKQRQELLKISLIADLLNKKKTLILDLQAYCTIPTAAKQ
jgi:hypothetical protein